MDNMWVALVSTVFAGAGLKILDHFFSKNKVRIDDATRIRDELRIEIQSQKEEIAKLEIERDKYRNDYYNLMDQVVTLKTEVSKLTNQIDKQQQEEK